jgi:hypothetical protein
VNGCNLVEELPRAVKTCQAKCETKNVLKDDKRMN